MSPSTNTAAVKETGREVVAHCEGCEWDGSPGDCEQYQEQDGWENPPYTVAICPKCGGEEVIFLEVGPEEPMVQLT